MDEAYSYLDDDVISIEDVIASAASLARYHDLYAFRCKSPGCFAPVQACATGANNVRRAYFAMHGDADSVERERTLFAKSALASDPNEFSRNHKYHRYRVSKPAANQVDFGQSVERSTSEPNVSALILSNSTF